MSKTYCSCFYFLSQTSSFYLVHFSFFIDQYQYLDHILPKVEFYSLSRGNRRISCSTWRRKEEERDRNIWGLRWREGPSLAGYPNVNKSFLSWLGQKKVFLFIILHKLLLFHLSACYFHNPVIILIKLLSHLCQFWHTDTVCGFDRFLLVCCTSCPFSDTMKDHKTDSLLEEASEVHSVSPHPPLYGPQLGLQPYLHLLK